MPDVIVPIIHPNGDRPLTLMQDLEAAYRAVRTAYVTLKQTAPNGRNYYVQPGLLAEAQAQYQRRLGMLKSLQEELLAEYQGIEKQSK